MARSSIFARVTRTTRERLAVIPIPAAAQGAGAYVRTQVAGVSTGGCIQARSRLARKCSLAFCSSVTKAARASV